MSDSIQFHADQVGSDVFIAPNATVLGDVTIGDESSVWFGAVIRGDAEAIRIGAQTNIQDLSVLHADEGFPCILGDRVTVGHSAIVHGAKVADDVLIGMRSVVMNGAKIGSGSIVAVGAIVTEGTEIPPNSIVIGVPGKVRRQAEERDAKRICHAALHYVENAKRYLAEL